MGVNSVAVTAIYLLILCSNSFGHIRINAPEIHTIVKNEPTFVRTAIESVPSDVTNGALSRISMRPSVGDIFLPLRSAVESVPTINLKTAAELRDLSTIQFKSFNRASVESVPLSEFDDDDDDEVANIEIIRNLNKEQLEKYIKNNEDTLLKSKDWSHSDKYAAYIVLEEDAFNPHEYRVDSPYQQLIKKEELEKLEQIDDVELINGQSPYGALAYSSNEQYNEDNRPYGALAYSKVNENSKKQFNTSPKVLCYMTNWAFYRQADGKFVPENLDSKLCTTIIYSFASLDPDHLNIKEFDPWVDNENKYYNRTVETGVPVLIAMGGWTDSSGDKYSRLAADAIKRKVFASNLVGFLNRNGFSGLHLDWNYPKCWQSDCKKGPASDKPNLTKLLREIRIEFDRQDKKLQLGVAISGYKEIIHEAYELPELSKIVDYMTAMTYDYHGSWERQTGHVSPLYGRKEDKYPQYNTDYAMQMLVKMGAKKDKLIMGIPFYGQSFTLEKPSTKLVGENIPTSAPGAPGEFTKQPGMLAYYEVCQHIRKDKWLVGRDTERKSGPFAMLNNQWVGYEDPASVEAKARYAVNNGFGGIAAWTVDLDDFQNRCCSEAFPLLKSINRALGRLNTEPPTRVNCEKPLQPVTPIAPVMTTVSSDGSAGHHEHSTWASWDPISTTTTPKTTRTTMTTTRRTTTTPTTKKPTSTTKTTTTTERTSTIWWAPSSTTKQPEQTTIPSPAVVRPVVQASNCQPGQFYADRSNCNAYYQCITVGELRQQFCPGGLHWNDQTKNCDWPASAQCMKKNKPIASARPTKGTTPPKRTTKRPITNVTHTSTTTTRTTQRTTSKRTTKHTTTNRPTTSRPSTTFRPSTTSTRFTTESPITQRTTRKQNQKPKPQKPKPNKPKKCKEGEYYSHKSCDQYYICINGALTPNSCGGNLHWDAIRKICDWPDNVQCVTTKKYLRIVEFKANPTDPCNGEERVPYPGDCSKYLFCLWNRFQGADCAPGLHFNQELGNCDWPMAAKCDMGGLDGDIEPIISGGDNSINQGSSSNKPDKPKTTKAPTTTTTSRPTYPTNKPDLQPLDGHYKVVCYFTNWAWYRKGIGRYTPDDINTDLCTHVVYGFAVLDYSNMILRTHDSWADIDNNFYTRVSALKEKGIKVTLALGGWNDSQGDKYSRLVRNPSSRRRFVNHAIEFLEKYGFEGLDLDWEYPVCWQTDCNKGMADEKEGFTSLVRELSEAFKPRGLLLSSAVSPSKKIIDAGYDVPELAKYFDWIAVMTYDFHGQWDKKTGHVAPMYYHPDDEIDYFNANYSINYWIEKGAPSRKIVMGMPLYGQAFTLENAQNHGLNSKAPGPGQAGEFTRAAGFLAYYEICDRVKHQGWQVVQDKLGRMGPYAFKGTQWVSYDDPAMIRKKSQYVRAMNLGGGMVWALDLDDFHNRCGEGIHPLLRQIHDILKDPPQDYEPLSPPTSVETMETVENSQEQISEEIESGVGEDYDEEKEMIENNGNEIDPNQEVEDIEDTEDTQVSEELPIDTETDGESATGSDGSNEIGTGDENESPQDYKVVCYFTNWAWYRQAGGKYLPEDIDGDLCTHIVYGFAVLNRETLTIQPHDSWADLDNNFYERVSSYRAKGIKVTVAIGGWNDSAGDKYSRLVRSAEARARFITHVMQFIDKYGFDGLDLDWEYPVCWQVDCTKGSPEEKESFTKFVMELSAAFKPKGLLLSSAVSPNKKVIDAGYEVSKLTNYFDWIAVMTYDYHGQWDKKTGHVAPMYDHPEGTPTFNANFSINYWIEQGADRRKLVMGMPMYGQSFTLAQASEHGLNAKTYGGGEAGEATRARGFLAYYEICSYIRTRGWTVVRDARGRMGPYAYLRDQWVSFDDAPMIRHKSEYVKAMGLGGAMIWALDLDDFKNKCDCESYPLLKTINRVLRNYPAPHAKCQLEEKDKLSIVGSTLPTPTPTISTAIISNNGETNSAYETFEIDEPEEMEDKKDCHGYHFKSHERDCNKYFICVHGQLIEQSCPSGLYWNENYCDWPKNTKCAVRQELTTQRPVERPKTTTTTLSPYKPSKKPISPPNKKPTIYPKPTIPPPLHDNNDYKVICYFTNWAWYRRGDGKYMPEDIDENLCTHVVYGFAVLNSNTLTIKTHDSWADIDNKFYERVAAYKNKGVRVTVAIGGWNDSLGSKYARLVLDPQARARFIKSVLDFIEKYGFEGLDLDWEYPVCWQVDCTKGSPQEKAAFAALVRELSHEFKKRDLLLSAAVSPSKKVIDAGYDVPTLAKYFDWIAVMTYDFHGHWDKQTGHVAPLFYVDGDPIEYFNANFTTHYWLEKGAPAKKLIMGMPLYGQSFSLADIKNRGLNEKSVGPGKAGKYTRAGGFLAYYEICELVNNGGYDVIRDPQGRIGPYAYSGNQWVSYDDVEDIRRKSKFVKSLGLGGGMVWALDLDDFRGRCGCGKHPLLRTLNQELRGIPGQRARDCT